jgi:hypothetical protein
MNTEKTLQDKKERRNEWGKLSDKMAKSLQSHPLKVFFIIVIILLTFCGFGLHLWLDAVIESKDRWNDVKYFVMWLITNIPAYYLGKGSGKK